MSKDRETELKYLVSTEAVLARIIEDARQLRFPGLPALAERFSGPFNRNDTYYDTSKLNLLRTGRCLRLGGTTPGFVRITYKERTSDLKTRIEINEEQESKNIDNVLSGKRKSRSIAALRQIIGKRELAPKLRVYKILYRVEVASCEVTFGHVVYAGPGGTTELLDLEVEAKNSTRQSEALRNLNFVGKKLSGYYGLALDMRSKYEMGMQLVGERVR